MMTWLDRAEAAFTEALSVLVVRWLVVVTGLLLLGGVVPVQADALLTDLSFTARTDGEGYVIRTRTTEPVEAYGMPERVGETTLKWVLYNTGLHDTFQKGDPDGPVQRYTVERQKGHVILRFHLTPDRSVTSNAYRDGVSSDLLLALNYKGDGPVANTRPDQSSTRASDPRSSSGAAVGGGVPGLGNVMDGARERWELDKIVIDPGHGGKDPGATDNGLYEKDIVLDVALQLGEYIENRLGISVAYTRTDDRFIPLEKRGEMANKAEAKLFLSLHVNASRVSRVHGTETYFLGPSKTEAARKVMRRENSVIRYEDDTEAYEEYDEEALVRETLTQSAFMRQSEHLASRVQNQFEERVHRHNRGVHQAGFYVLWSASMPAVLVELGFLTNDREARFLNSDQGQTYLASALFRAVRAYKNRYEKGIVATGD